MPYIVPTFPLVVNLWSNADLRASWPVLPPPSHADIPAQLRPPFKQPVGTIQTSISGTIRELIVPKTTSVRLPTLDSGEYWVDCPLLEVPSGSDRWYIILDGDRVAYGFPNEYISLCVIPTRQFEGNNFSTLPGYPWFPDWVDEL